MNRNNSLLTIANDYEQERIRFKKMIDAYPTEVKSSDNELIMKISNKRTNSLANAHQLKVDLNDPKKLIIGTDSCIYNKEKS